MFGLIRKFVSDSVVAGFRDGIERVHRMANEYQKDYDLKNEEISIPWLTLEGEEEGETKKKKK